MSTDKIIETFKKQSQVRYMSAPVQVRAETVELEDKPKRFDSECYVEGYAATFDKYVLFEDEDGPIYEQFERGCFANADTSDVIMQFDHAGRVFARNRNNTLILEEDEHGLFTAADLSKTQTARSMYEDIEAGLVCKMSWRFALGEWEYLPSERLFLHHSVKKIYDVSAVSIPANDTTEINARAWGDGEIALAARRDAELENKRKRLKLKTKMEVLKNGQN